MTLTSLFVFACALFVAAGSPGPSVAALVARVISKGARDVLPFLSAMWLGEAIWLTCAVAGLAAIAETFHYAFVAIKWLGVCYLLYLAWKMWFASPDSDGEALPEAQSPTRLFLAGMTVTLGNPKIMMFYMALLPSIIDVRGVTIVGWAELVATMLFVLIFIDFSWTLLAAKARRFLRSRRAIRAANRASAGTMAGAALAIAMR
ncbi:MULTISPECIES: LysE family translocator [Rhizobium]|jgi:threonine/homoserine/homoserine lactone efflux protein|uniref:Lysine transporter LysE n=1 Tax=Rhizobium altiplani TaxID=1864509 RepID=A0A109J2X4_9HYPH|nr:MULTISPECIES: LysE family translocator [Rhizobium]KWV41334.1 lysine transporter LysE [Rhizobium altiplani]MBD9445596.1 LysE family translocator [Rhizobium sp. RHZ01]MBD9451882.1 LysE family translocator [Rhizobium sp. RHZ02]NMN68664.1 threonine/homoserine/homoserine lactone efflux protein [Rhizobium sp. 57MFTsu3.2]